MIQPIRCRYGEFDRSIDRNLVVEMQSCFSSKGLALSTSIGKHCLPRIVALEIMNNNRHVVSAIVSRHIVSNSIGGGGSLGDGLKSLG